MDGDDQQHDIEEQDSDDPLVRRLRELEWPSAPPEVRERCFADMQRRLAELGVDGSAVAEEAAGEEGSVAPHAGSAERARRS